MNRIEKEELRLKAKKEAEELRLQKKFEKDNPQSKRSQKRKEKNNDKKVYLLKEGRFEDEPKDYDFAFIKGFAKYIPLVVFFFIITGVVEKVADANNNETIENITQNAINETKVYVDAHSNIVKEPVKKTPMNNLSGNFGLGKVLREPFEFPMFFILFTVFMWTLMFLWKTVDRGML